VVVFTNPYRVPSKGWSRARNMHLAVIDQLALAQPMLLSVRAGAVGTVDVPGVNHLALVPHERSLRWCASTRSELPAVPAAQRRFSRPGVRHKELASHPSTAAWRSG
jgi:hypothetical protein